MDDWPDPDKELRELPEHEREEPRAHSPAPKPARTRRDQGEAPPEVAKPTLLEATIEQVAEGLRAVQAPNGHWSFELEADTTITSEYVLLRHFLGEIDTAIEAKLANYLRDTQADHGGWPLFPSGDFDISATVKAYYALKLAGDDADAPHMVRAREAVLAHGGAAHCNVFTRITLALFRQVPWRAVPMMPVEIMLLPKWFPFHLSKISYWSRTVMVPLLILMARRPEAKNPGSISIEELFVTPPWQEKHYLVNVTGKFLGRLFIWFDWFQRCFIRFVPKRVRDHAIAKALTFTSQRANGTDGLGAIFPAMANTVMALATLGYGPDHPQRKTAMEAVTRLLVLGANSGHCQPCFSPIWDTALASQALLELGTENDHENLTKAANWMLDRQVLDVVGDWAENRPGLRPGGWAFQYNNDFYPDLDDTAAVAIAIDRIAATTETYGANGSNDPARGERIRRSLERATEWVLGMQSKDGGWASFDVDNTYDYLNQIHFADHGARLDPPTADVTARCLGMLLQLGYGRDHPAVARGLDFLRREQEQDGSWYGRWGTNYIYGTWSVLIAFKAAGENAKAIHVRKAVTWLKSRQRDDGGWGEDGATYWNDRKHEVKASTPSQTAWALLALMAAGEVDSDAVRRGISYLLGSPRHGAGWEEKLFTAVGFPKVFYLRYHGYSHYFPLWALVRYRNYTKSNPGTKVTGM